MFSSHKKPLVQNMNPLRTSVKPKKIFLRVFIASLSCHRKSSAGTGGRHDETPGPSLCHCQFLGPVFGGVSFSAAFCLIAEVTLLRCRYDTLHSRVPFIQ